MPYFEKTLPIWIRERHNSVDFLSYKLVNAKAYKFHHETPSTETGFTGT